MRPSDDVTTTAVTTAADGGVPLVRVEDGTAEASKPLWAVLQEAKEAKEEAFAQGWKTIKQGQNKPLDEEEIEFLDEVEDTAREEERRRLERERDDVETFRLAREIMVVKAAPEPAPPAKRARRVSVFSAEARKRLKRQPRLKRARRVARVSPEEPARAPPSRPWSPWPA